MAAVGVAYTFVGGIRAVIWTDVVQTIVFVGAAIAAVVVLVMKIPAPPGEVVSALAQPGTSPAGGSKLAFLKIGLDPTQPGLGFDPSQAYTLLTALIGFTIFNVSAYGTDHDLTQRMLTCKSAVKGGQSAVIAILIS